MGIEETLSQVRAGLPRLDPAQAYALSADDDTFIVDTRPEFQRRAAGEIPGALVIERNHLEWRLDPTSDARIPEAVSADIRWIVVCEGGYSSSLAADSLRRIGLHRSTDVIGGFNAWQANGLPVVAPPPQARSSRVVR
ncbi:rhodanese-like domain-containing protein [Kribbella shirazensis]|uniref:Rhodanese-related sulfurtransferase n=1 Tax=Kribbella shirazensis TaxID=1105143 RepID=A0A7X5VF67_9ACTN|nr:rhodanese-like domain-containing protein [Kribbella shirazensis]NIK60058.1 rhodanese-related sulfurtransferase [Kribbella shirazensis]